MEQERLMTNRELALELAAERELCDNVFTALFRISTYGPNKMPAGCYEAICEYEAKRGEWYNCDVI